MTTQPTTVPAGETITLNTGAEIPVIGLGTWPLLGSEAERTVASALERGYRHVDTAAKYENEAAVGAAIASSGIDRGSLFVTSKIRGSAQVSGDVRAALEGTLERLGLDYLDLYLIHWPLPSVDKYVQTYTTMLSLREEGLVRSVGVSNFKPAHLQRLIDETGAVPAINQIQLDPTLVRREVRDVHARFGVTTQAWSPLGRGGDLLREPVVTALADKYGKTVGQIVLRWHVQQGIVAVPKSADPQRQAQNLDVFDLALAPEEIAALTALDRGEAAARDSDQEEEF